MDPRLEFLQTALAARAAALEEYRAAAKVAAKAQKNWEEAARVVDVARDSLWSRASSKPPPFGVKSKKR